MPDSGADASFHPNQDKKFDALLLFCKWLDITDKKAQEDHIAIIIKELSHRAKNLLAVITAMARCTILQSHNFEHFEAAFCARIHGLSRSHDLLVRQDWMGVMVFDLARQQLQPFMDVGGDRLSLIGANIYISPALAQAIGMAFHELATNAVKYGALSTTTGHLSIACESTADGYRLSWTERGGPTVRKPQTRGFGHVVTVEMLSETLGCDARVEFDPKGVVWSATIRYADVSELNQTAAR